MFLVAEQLNTRRCVCVCVSSVFAMIILSKRPSSYCLIHFGGSLGASWGQKTTFDGRRPSMEDYLPLKTTFDRRRPSMQDDFRWKMTFDGRQLMGEG